MYHTPTSAVGASSAKPCSQAHRSKAVLRVVFVPSYCVPLLVCLHSANCRFVLADVLARPGQIPYRLCGICPGRPTHILRRPVQDVARRHRRDLPGTRRMKSWDVEAPRA
eukprot:354545-Chlamydomonas_euryale.AAC.12